jgi:hypothetical protein
MHSASGLPGKGLVFARGCRHAHIAHVTMCLEQGAVVMELTVLHVVRRQH